MRRLWKFGAVMLLGGLAGCVAPTPPPLVAVPGPAKTDAAFRQDDAACRAVAAALPPVAAPSPVSQHTAAASTNGQAAVQPAAAEPLATPPRVVYLNCMTAHNNAAVPLPRVQPAYVGYPAYPVYAGFGDYYPWLYGNDVVGFYGFYGGCCGWYGGGFQGGWDQGGFRR